MKYNSKYSPGKQVSEFQYIVETMCERRASNLNIDLPTYFWRLPEWRGYFVYQSKLCSSLMKKYSGQAILKALKDPKYKYIYSLKVKKLEGAIQQYQKEIDSTDYKENFEVVENAEYKPRTNKNSVYNRLEELE